jgi:hypothetical protein
VNLKATVLEILVGAAIGGMAMLTYHLYDLANQDLKDKTYSFCTGH